MVAQGFVLLSQEDGDATGPPAVATVSKDDAWDDGGYAIGAAAAAAGALWCDRPYFTGNPAVDWMVAKADRVAAAGGFVQIGNEQNLVLEGWRGGRDEWFAFEDAVRARVAFPDTLLAMPPSPGMPGWRAWVRDVGAHAIHAYGDCAGMTAIVDWYLHNTTGDVYVTECNFGAGNAVDVDAWSDEELRPFLDWCVQFARVKLAAYFAWVWRGAPPMPTAVDARGTAIETLIRDWTPPEVPVATLTGVDVSNHQGTIDWAAVARAGRRFALIKASEDPVFVDGWFARNWAGAKSAGLTRGAYHFARPSESAPADSVTHFQRRLTDAGGLCPGDLVALDIEDERVPAGQDLSGWVAEWLALAEDVLGVRPVVYSGYWYLAPHGLLTPALGAYPLWYASYQPTRPPAPAPWERIVFWQFSAHGTVPGVSGDCDENRFDGTAADLAALGYAGAPAPPADDYDVDAARDRLWAEATALEQAGWPWFGQGIKSVVSLSKGER